MAERRKISRLSAKRYCKTKKKEKKFILDKTFW